MGRSIVMTETVKGRPSRRTAARGWVALLLLSAGTLVLAGRVWPLAGDALALVLGLELVAWAWIVRDDGPLIAGGIVTGVGTGVLLAAGPLADAAPHVVGGTFLLCAAFGFAVVGLLSRLLLPSTHTWAWITAAVVAAAGSAVFAGADIVSQVITWALPVALLITGILLGARWLRIGRR
jgi:hypothetical protein